MTADPITIQSTPTADQIEQQLKRLCKDRLMQGGLRRHLLRWLLDFKASGKYDAKPRPNSKTIFADFYEFAKRELGVDIPRETEPSGKKLFGELADALEDYYAGPGTADSILITLQGGIGGGFEPLIEFKAAVERRSVSSHFEPGERNHVIINDSIFISEVEAKAPDGTTEIWVATPDLSNVGDETSPFSELVRASVSGNARRGIDYAYICPKGHAGHSRIDHLSDCFVGTSGKLRLYEVPPERFDELTLVQSHFVSLNPRADIPDVYMQLPLSQPQKGWIKLSRKDGLRILAKIKSFMTQYQPENGQSVHP